ncbi:isochorismatase family protein [Rhodospirillales bacterium]|nr:isochorismatase family protein [Rhodospirillales bacterium]
MTIVGFQTHMYVSATTRAALDLGYRNTLVVSAIATRDLPSATGESDVPAEIIHQTTLAALADRFAIVAKSPDDISD